MSRILRLAVVGALLAVAAPLSAGTFRDGHPSMGTVLEITVVAQDAEQASAAVAACYARAEELEALFTTWQPASALNRLNAGAGGEEQDVPEALARILEDARALAEQTEGAFDPTVGPLVKLWRKAREIGRLPGPAQLAAARRATGYRGIEIDGDEARLARPGMAADLGGFAKGWTLDRLGELLSEHGIERALLSYGQSSLLGLGVPEDADAWRVLVRDARGGYAGVASLRDVSLSVSESFGESALVEGRRIGHLIDPRTGMTLDRQTGAVIVAADGATAEAWSKALLVLPTERAFTLLADREGVEGLLLEPSGADRATLGFHAALQFAPPPTP